MRQLAALAGSLIILLVGISNAQNIDHVTSTPVTEGLHKNNIYDDYAEISADSSWWYRIIENKAFGLGEKLEYAVNYGIIPAGMATLEIEEIVSISDYDCYNIKSIVHSNSVISVFYRVRDTVQTYIDTVGIFPRKFRKVMIEGDYNVDKTVLFDQKKHIAIAKTDTIPTYAFVQDVLSCLYYLRTQDVELGIPYSIELYSNQNIFPMKVNVLRREIIKVPAGEFNCIVVEPIMIVDGTSRFNTEGKIQIWLTDDQFRIPVFMKTKVSFFGSVTGRLTKYTIGEIEGREN